MAMKIKTMGYCVKQGAINLYKNRLMSLASIGTISACILVIGIFYSIVANVEYMISELENNVGIEIFFVEGTTEKQILDLKTDLDNNPLVYNTVYTSAEEAWETFKAQYFEGREELLAGFARDNPLENSASLRVFVSDLSKQEQLVNYIKNFSHVRSVKESLEVTNVIENVSGLIKVVSITLIAILVIVSMFLISNTIRLAIELRKAEINIMKYIGATDSFIRGPFITEGAAIGLLGVVLPLTIIYVFYTDVIGKIMNYFYILDNFLVFMSIQDIFTKLVPLSLVIGAGIGIVGSMLTIHRHLKV